MGLLWMTTGWKKRCHGLSRSCSQTFYHYQEASSIMLLINSMTSLTIASEPGRPVSLR